MDKLVKVLWGQHCGWILLKDPEATWGLRGRKLMELSRGTRRRLGSVWWEHPRSKSLSPNSVAPYLAQP